MGTPIYLNPESEVNSPSGKGFAAGQNPWTARGAGPPFGGTWRLPLRRDSGHQFHRVPQLPQTGDDAAGIHHVAGADGQKDGVLPRQLQLLRRRGDHAGVTFGEELGVELVVAVDNRLLAVDL